MTATDLYGVSFWRAFRGRRLAAFARDYCGTTITNTPPSTISRWRRAGQHGVTITVAARSMLSRSRHGHTNVGPGQTNAVTSSADQQLERTSTSLVVHRSAAVRLRTVHGPFNAKRALRDNTATVTMVAVIQRYAHRYPRHESSSNGDTAVFRADIRRTCQKAVSGVTLRSTAPKPS